jgi:hypothetical protein
MSSDTLLWVIGIVLFVAFLLMMMRGCGGMAGGMRGGCGMDGMRGRGGMRGGCDRESRQDHHETDGRGDREADRGGQPARGSG